MAYKDKDRQREYQKNWERKNRRGKRHKLWLAPFYPEDCLDWEIKISERGIPCLVSPLHDKDTWTERDERANANHKAGELKKPHRHAIMEYDHAVSNEQFQDDFSFLAGENGTLRGAIPGRSRAASTLYLTHETKDCERLGKAQYNPEKVLEFCGASYSDWKSKLEDSHSQMKAMRLFIRENGIIEPADFQDYCDNEAPEWSWLLDTKCQNSIFRYIDRNRARLFARREKTLYCDSPASPPQGGSEPRTPNQSQERKRDDV